MGLREARNGASRASAWSRGQAVSSSVSRSSNQWIWNSGGSGSALTSLVAMLRSWSSIMTV